MLVGRTAIQARTLGDLDDRQTVGPTFGKEFAGCGDQSLVRSLRVASKRTFSSAGKKVAFRLVPHDSLLFPARSASFAHFWPCLPGPVSNIAVAHIKTIMYVGLTLARPS